jgi:cytochrome c553
MKPLTKAGVIVASAAILGAAGGALFIGSGFYNIGADDHHTKLVLALIEQLRERSIEVRASSVGVPNLEPGRAVRGAARYSDLCASCHLAPGVTKSPIRAGLYPHPPNLAQEEPRQAREAFWIIKHGIKMSAMPAWGKTLDDEAIWDLVAFVREMPGMTAEAYQAAVQTSHCCVAARISSGDTSRTCSAKYQWCPSGSTAP